MQKTKDIKDALQFLMSNQFIYKYAKTTLAKPFSSYEQNLFFENNSGFLIDDFLSNSDINFNNVNYKFLSASFFSEYGEKALKYRYLSDYYDESKLLILPSQLIGIGSLELGGYTNKKIFLNNHDEWPKISFGIQGGYDKEEVFVRAAMEALAVYKANSFNYVYKNETIYKEENIDIFIKDITPPEVNAFYKVIRILMPDLLPVMLPSLPYHTHPKIINKKIEKYIHPLA